MARRAAQRASRGERRRGRPPRPRARRGPPAGRRHGAGSPFAGARRRRRRRAHARRPARDAHHAEAVATAPGKRTVTFEIPVATETGDERRTYTDIDTTRGAYAYETLGLSDDEFAVIAAAALEAGIGSTGTVGAAACHLFPAAGLTRFAADWIDRHFTSPPRGV